MLKEQEEYLGWKKNVQETLILDKKVESIEDLENRFYTEVKKYGYKMSKAFMYSILSQLLEEVYKTKESRENLTFEELIRQVNEIYLQCTQRCKEKHEYL